MEIFKDFETGSAVDMGSNPILTIDIKAYGYWQWQLVGPRWPVSFITLQQVQGYLHDYSFFTRPLSMSVLKTLKTFTAVAAYPGGVVTPQRVFAPGAKKPCASTGLQILLLLIPFHISSDRIPLNQFQSNPNPFFISKFPIYLLRKWMKRKNLIKPKRFRISQLKFPHFSENGLINMR